MLDSRRNRLVKPPPRPPFMTVPRGTNFFTPILIFVGVTKPVKPVKPGPDPILKGLNHPRHPKITTRRPGTILRAVIFDQISVKKVNSLFCQ